MTEAETTTEPRISSRRWLTARQLTGPGSIPTVMMGSSASPCSSSIRVKGTLYSPRAGSPPAEMYRILRGSQTLHLQPAGGNGFAHRNRGEGALEDPADIGAVIRQQGITFHRLLHGFLQDGFKARDGLPAQFKLHFHSPLRSWAAGGAVPSFQWNYIRPGLFYAGAFGGVLFSFQGAGGRRVPA